MFGLIIVHDPRKPGTWMTWGITSDWHGGSYQLKRTFQGVVKFKPLPLEISEETKATIRKMWAELHEV